MASYLVSSQEETLAEPTRKQYKSFSEEFNAWRGDNEITDDLVCLYVREYLKGSENIENRLREDFTLKPHKPSSTKTMYSCVNKYLRNHGPHYLTDTADRRIQSYLDTKEKRTPLKQAPVITREDIQTFTVVPEILSRVLHKDSQGRDAKILDLWVGNQSCKKDSHPPQLLQKHSRCCRILSSPPFLLKKHSHMSHNHPLTTLFKMTCAKQIPTRCKTILIQALSHLPCLSPIVVFLLMISYCHI